MVNMWLRHAHCLHYNVIYTCFEFVCLYDTIVTTDLVQNKLIGAFASNCIVSLINVFNKGVRFFIDCVVCEMHAQIAQISWSWCLIFDSCKTSKAIFKDVDSERIDSIDKDIQTKVELEPIDQIWFVHVSLYHHGLLLSLSVGVNDFICCQILSIPCQKYSFTLTARLWLNNEGFISFLSDLAQEFFLVLGQYKGLWKEAEIIWEYRLKLHKIPTQHIFLS